MNLLIALARALVGRPAPRPPEEAFRAVLPLTNPLETDEGRDGRREATLRVMDPDCYGYLVLTVHASSGMRAEVGLAAHIRPEWWPAVAETLERVVEVHKSHLY